MEFPSEMFQIPAQGTKVRQRLALFIDENVQAVSPFLPWLTVELIDCANTADFLSFLEIAHAERLRAERLHALYPQAQQRHERLQHLNGYQDVYEIQSLSGFYESLQRYLATQMVRDDCPSRVIKAHCGVSLRTIQRIRKTVRTRA